ncbi:cytochrome c3 family protein [Desulfuromonas versatilis]|uniref:cytochrome c3 family protein n=1 Tax=Desulfuromonas versatilis TaxID=2802975 RepID=UPI001CED3B69|nr:cytochrome c3 family protein [Desulfuromonas versatilis]
MRHKFKNLLLMLLLAAPLAAGAPAAEAMETEDCLGCHGDRDAVAASQFIDGARFDHTAHAEMGCLACHETVSDAHPDDGLTPSRASCRDCHEDIYQEYATSIHGANASCADCHNPHQVKSPTEVSGYDMNRQCASCHDLSDMVSTHDEWLPQAELHVGALPCIACHSGSKDYAITLYITTRQKAFGDFDLADRRQLQELAGSGNIEALVDLDGDGQASLKELRIFNQKREYKNLRLAGMMIPERVTHDFQILDNRWDCTFCHASGPEAMQTSYLAFPEDGGTFSRLPVEQGAVLDALYGTPDFYMMGATRSKALNIVGLMIIAGGLVMPVGHGTLRFLTRNNRKEH